MQKSKVDIGEITLNEQKHLFSWVQKQNDSGIMFNDRIFFLVPDKHIGYVSDIKASEPQNIPFQKAKHKIPIENIKTILVSEKEFKVKYFVLQDSKKVQKVWLFKATDPSLAKKWQDKLQHEKTKQQLRKQPPPQPVQTQTSPKKGLIKINSPVSRQRKPLTLSRAIQLSQHPKKMTQSIEVGTDPAQKQPEEKTPVKQLQKKEMGTIITERDSKSQLRQHVLNKYSSKKDAQVGTSFIQEQKQDGKPAQEKIQDYTDRSMPPEPTRVNKSIRSESPVKKIQPQYLSQKGPINGRNQNKQVKKSQQPTVKAKIQSINKEKSQPKQKEKSQTVIENEKQPTEKAKSMSKSKKQPYEPSVLNTSRLPSEIPYQTNNDRSRSKIELVSNRGQPSKVDQSIQQADPQKIDQSIQPFQPQKIDKSIQMTHRSRRKIQKEVLDKSKSKIESEVPDKSRSNTQSKAPDKYKSKIQSEVPDKSRIIEESKHHYEKLEPSKINKSKANQPNIVVNKSEENKPQKQEEQPSQSHLNETLKDISKIDRSKEYIIDRSSFQNPYIQDSAQINQKDQTKQLQKSNKPSLSNVKYISPQEYEKLNLSASYYERASKLIKQSSVPKSKWNQSQKSNEDLNKQLQTQNKGNISIKTLEDKKLQKSDSQFQRKENSERNSAKKDLNKLLLPTGQKSIKEEVQSFADQLQEIPWAFKYVKYNELMFEEYLDFTYDLMQQLLKDLARPKQTQLYSLTYVKDNIRYYEVKDIEVKIAFLETSTKHRGAAGSDKVCNKNSIKHLRNEFKNFKALYEYLQDSPSLKVPLICLHEMNGFLGSFKIKVKSSEQQIKMKQIEDGLNKLKARSKIDHNFYQNYNKNLIKLHKTYYNNFKDKNNEYDQKINFDCIFIQEIDGYLMQDLVSDYEKPQLALLRKELIVDYTQKMPKEKQNFISKKSTKKAIQNLSQNVLKKISQVIYQINSVYVYFFNSTEISTYLHEKGINMRYLGYIYDYLNAGFQKDLFMTEMAARSCKALFRKTLQDIVLQGGQGRVDILLKAYDFLNCVLGNKKQTKTIWKVLGSHCKSYFGVDLCFDEINPGQFIICLVQNCRLDVVWQKINPDQAFKSSYFFSQRNLIGIKANYKIYEPIYNDMYQFCQEIFSKEQNEQNYQRMMDYLSLENKKFPKILQTIQQKIKKYIALFQSPDNDKLGIYVSDLNYPSKFNFDTRVIKINWELKNDDKENYIESCDDFLRLVTKFYGEFHPIFSVLYDTFSTYHLTQDNFQDAVTFAKSSLVNMLKICGTTHQKTAESYFKLGLCYMKAKKNDEAGSNFKKAKKILQDKKQTDTLFYAVLLLKLSLLSLNENNLEQSLKNANRSLTILQKLGTKQSENQLIECYQTITRCYQLKRNKNQLRQLSRSIANKLNLIQTQTNLQKILKIYLYPILTDITSQSASNYLDIISQLHPPTNEQNYKNSFTLLKKRIAQGKFNEIVFEYMHKINSIDSYIRDTNLLKDWESFKDEYQRQTVNDFVSLTQELICFLGEGFIGGALREAL